MSFIKKFSQAASATNTSQGLTAQGPGLAVHGYDVVSYFTTGTPEIGDARFATVFEQATYQFASQEHLDAFRAAPQRYVPAYGGYCAYGVAVGAKFDGDPRLWRIVGDTLYLNLNAEIQRTWEQDIDGNIAAADQNWPKIAEKSPHQLS